MSARSPILVAVEFGHLSGALRRLRGKPFTWAYLGQRIDEFYRASALCKDNGSYLDTTHAFHEAAEELRDPYLAFIFNIGRKMDSLRWWITSLSYRSTYVSKTFHRVCYLKVALNLLARWDKQETLVVVLSDRCVGQALLRNLPPLNRDNVHLSAFRSSLAIEWALGIARMLVHRAAFMLRETYRLVVSRLMDRKPYVPRKLTTLVLSSVSAGSFHLGGEFHRYFFGDLANKLAEQGYDLAFVPRILNRLPYRRVLANLRNASAPVLVPSRYLRFRDLLAAALSTFRKPSLPVPIPAFELMDISTLLREEIRSYWISNGEALALLVSALVRRWAKIGCPISRMIYVYENQPWERALCWQAKRSLPDTVLVGYQHANVEKLFLNFHLAPGEESIAPLPDHVITVGQQISKLLSSNGYKPNQVRVGGALQTQGLLQGTSRAWEPDSFGHNAKVLVATSDGLAEAAELVDLAVRLFDSGQGVKVVLKCHPGLPFEKISKLNSLSLPEHVELSDEPITGLMPDSSLMVYSGSSVCFQALALGLPVIHLRPQFDFDLDPLEATPEARLEAAGLEELRQKVSWLLENRAEYVAEHQEDWHHVVQEMYGPITEETYRAFVEVDRIKT